MTWAALALYALGVVAMLRHAVLDYSDAASMGYCIVASLVWPVLVIYSLVSDAVEAVYEWIRDDH
jgi:hypothetical protein